MAKISVIVPAYNVENYIFDMLISLRDQSFADFEVVMVDDGSTDRSAFIAESFAEKDGRFRLYRQKNAGVSAARNFGLSQARGEFVVFYDPDDYIPRNALEKTYEAGKAAGADIVVGVMEEKNLGESVIYMDSQKLAKMKSIAPEDEHFIGAWSVCNKAFARDFLRANGLEFENISNAEDGVFTFRALNHARRITGCDAVTYNYVRRPFWESASATQIVDKRYFTQLLASHARIIEEAQKLSSRLDAEKQRAYMSKLYFRFLNIEMINAYYRLIWKAEEAMLPLLFDKMKEYAALIGPEQQEALIRRNPDLELERGFAGGDFMTAAEMAEKPLVSVILAAAPASASAPAAAAVPGGEAAFSGASALDLAVEALYNQGFPRFEIIADETAAAKISSPYKERLNFRLVATGDLRAAVEAARGPYVTIGSGRALHTKTSLMQMAGRLSADSRLDFVSVLMRSVRGGKISEIPVLEAAYGWTPASRRRKSGLEGWDLLPDNKLFRRESLINVLAGGFAGMLAGGIAGELRDELRGEKLRRGAMLTALSEEDFEKLAGRKPPAALLRRRLRAGKLAARVRGWARRKVTREDVDKVKKILRR